MKIDFKMVRNVIILFVLFSILSYVLYLFIRNMEQFDTSTTITYYYLPNCGWCKKFTPVWEEFEKEAKMLGIVARKVDANEAVEEIKKYDIKGFPHVQIVKGDKVIVFEEERTKEALINFVKKNL